MKPIIGIIVRENIDNPKYLLLNNEICKSIVKHGGIPIGIFPNDDDINIIMNICNGFILQGGDEFTDFDIKIVKIIWELDKPLLGICLGMQTIGYTFEGTIRNINKHNHKSFDKYVHYINIMPNTKLYNILKENRILINSRHIDFLYNTSLKVSSISDDYIIESIEDSNKKFFIGVQWHPETLIDDLNSEKLFKEFIDSCKGDIK